jgi:hypothetical protein
MRAWVPRAIVVGLLLLTSGAAVLGAHASSSHRSASSPVVFGPPTGFGGYTWSGNLEEIRAEWRVPAVVGGAAFGTSVTWIGAQDRYDRGPFIQLGTYAFLGGQKSVRPSYGVFWSDTARQYHAVRIVGLKHPGDLISFEMIRKATGWELKVEDLSSGWTRSVDVHYGAGDTYDQGEWLQEDPTDSLVTATDVPYADTSTITFQRLEVNGHEPRLEFSDAQALSTTSGVDLAPTHVQDDDFSLVPAQGAALQYLVDAERFDSALYPATVLLIEQRSGDAQVRPSAVRTWSIASGRFASELQAQSWPSSAQGAAQRLGEDLHDLQRTLLTLSTLRHVTISELERVFADRARDADVDASLVRTILGLPPAR